MSAEKTPNKRRGLLEVITPVALIRVKTKYARTGLKFRIVEFGAAVFSQAFIIPFFIGLIKSATPQPLLIATGLGISLFFISHFLQCYFLERTVLHMILDKIFLNSYTRPLTTSIFKLFGIKIDGAEDNVFKKPKAERTPDGLRMVETVVALILKITAPMVLVPALIVTLSNPLVVFPVSVSAITAVIGLICIAGIFQAKWAEKTFLHRALEYWRALPQATQQDPKFRSESMLSYGRTVDSLGNEPGLQAPGVALRLTRTTSHASFLLPQ